VARIARRRLLRLRQQELLVIVQNVPHLEFAIGQLDHIRGLQRPAAAGQLRETRVQMRAAAEHDRGADRIPAPDHRRFDAAAVAQIDDDRDHARTRKKHMVDRAAGFANDIAVHERQLSRALADEIRETAVQI
jgi:hypothetical protein